MRRAVATLSARNAVLAAAVLACASCGQSEVTPVQGGPAKAASAAPAPREKSREAARAPRANKAPPLPEDPVAAKRASEQWDEHLAEEEHKRQLVFDRDRMPAHRALIAQIVAARARYDRASTEPALNAARTAMSAQLTKIQDRVTKLDPWSNSSHLLPDYAALQAALAASYPAAKLAALRGDASALLAAQASFDQRMHEMREWLEDASHAKGEGEEDEEHERETSQR